MSKMQVVAAGHVCLDVTPLFPAEKTGTPAELLIPGSLLRMEGADVHTGGSVANTGLAMAFFGADVHLCGKVGQDAFGKMILDILQSHGGDVSGMKVDPHAVTSYSVVLALPGQDRIFLHAPGANDTFTAEDVDFETVKNSRLFHFGYPPLMRGMYENTGAELVKLFRAVKATEAATSLDMAAIDPESDAARVDWRTVLARLLPYVDLFLPSVEELTVMLGRPLRKDLMETLSIEDDVAPLGEELLAMGAKIVVIKCGDRGLYYCTAADLSGVGEKAALQKESWEDRRGFQKAFPPEKLCSATGAGDTCIAAFLTAMLEGRSLEECITLAAAAGASCVEAYDALSGLRPFAEMEEKIARGWGKE